MSKKKLITKLMYAALVILSLGHTVMAAEHCSDQYYINQTLPNGASWDMCWSHNKNKGIRYHHIFYKPINGTRSMVMFEASIAQVHVPYDDNGARFHDVSDFGLGDDGGSNNNLVRLSSSECSAGRLGYFNNKAAVCSQSISSGVSYRNGREHQKSQALTVFSMSKVGQYVYVIRWNFHDDGRITPTIEATGALQRLGTSAQRSHGWLVNASGQIGLAHMHNFYWRLDFDLDGTSNNDVVKEINFDSQQGRRYKRVSSFSREAARSVSPQNMRTWVVQDGSSINRKGHPISYEIRLEEAGQREVGPAFEAFTHNDIYITRARGCELFASHNAQVNTCNANNLSEFVNGESIVNEDIVAWVGVSFYHMPRAEDAPKMDAHVSGFQLIPRDWHPSNPALGEGGGGRGGSGNSNGSRSGGGSTSVLLLLALGLLSRRFTLRLASAV